jgi:opacity protein-like surface antigen
MDYNQSWKVEGKMKRMVWLAVVFLLCASPVSAEITEGNFSATLGGLGYLSDGVQHQHVGPGMTAKLGYDFTKHFGLEGSFDYILSESTKSKSWWGSRYAFRLDALFHFLPDGRFVPYVSGGAGFIYSDDLYPYKEYSISRNHTDFLISVGGGAEFFITDAIALRADLRPIAIFGDGTLINYEAMLGVSYHFGGSDRKATPPLEKEPRVIVQEEANCPEVVPAPVPLPTPIDEGPNSWEGTETRVPAGKIMITGMKIEGNALVITATGRLVNYKVFSLSQPSRLVLDLGQTVNGMGTNKITVHKLGIAAVRFGSYPDALRVVLDSEQTELFPYRIQEMENGLKIIMTPSRK